MKKYKTEKRFKFNREKEELEPYWVVYLKKKRTRKVLVYVGLFKNKYKHIEEKVKYYQGEYVYEDGRWYYEEYEFSTKEKAQKYILTKLTN